jgi:hypothetical protein
MSEKVSLYAENSKADLGWMRCQCAECDVEGSAEGRSIRGIDKKAQSILDYYKGLRIRSRGKDHN